MEFNSLSGDPVHLNFVFSLNRVIPHICAKFPLAHFIIGGDGPKKLLLEEMRERNLLHDRVELLGEVPHYRVRDVSFSPIFFLSSSLDL